MTCYDPQGNTISGGASPAWYPCNSTTNDGHVPCCQPDVGPCLPNLACANYNDNTTLIRGGCTDITFKSPNCPQFLHEQDPEGLGNLILNCGNGTGCYNPYVHDSAKNCSCEPGAPNLLLIFSSSIVYASTASIPGTTITVISTTTAVSTGTTVSSPTGPPQPEGSNSDLRIGLPVGLVGGLILLGILIYLLWRRRSKRFVHSEKSGAEPGVSLGTSNHLDKRN